MIFEPKQMMSWPRATTGPHYPERPACQCREASPVQTNFTLPMSQGSASSSSSTLPFGEGLVKACATCGELQRPGSFQKLREAFRKLRGNSIKLNSGQGPRLPCFDAAPPHCMAPKGKTSNFMKFDAFCTSF